VETHLAYIYGRMVKEIQKQMRWGMHPKGRKVAKRNKKRANMTDVDLIIENFFMLGSMTTDKL